MMITTRKLAELAGVSQATVSRCLNDSHEVSQETKERVRNLAKEHGYIIRRRRKNTVATAQRKEIAIIVSEISEMDAYLRALYNTLFNLVIQENYFPMLLFCTEESMLHRIDELTETGIIDGYIIITRAFNEEADKKFRKLLIPRVYVHYFSRYSLESINMVDTDQFLGGFLATKHLIQLGHRHIAAFTSVGREFEDRTSGYFAALREAGLPTDNKNVFTIPRSYDGGYRMIMDNQKIIHHYTGIFVQNDPSAIGCINALHDLGVQIPEQISVIGYDGIEEGKFCRPELTTIEQPLQRIAEVVMDFLLQAINRPGDSAMRTFIQPNVILRKSTGPAPQIQ